MPIAIHKGIIRSYTPSTHKAHVQLVGSLPTVLNNVPVATDIPSAEVIAGRESSVLLFDEHNPIDAVVFTVHGAAPTASSSGLKTAGGGYFLIPTGPAVGTAVASSATNNTYGSWVQMIASTGAAIYIVGVMINPPSGVALTYVQLDIGIGAAGAEVSVGEHYVGGPPTSAAGWRPVSVYLPFPIPVPASTRIACRTANDGASSRSHLVTLMCINQADLVPI